MSFWSLVCSIHPVPCIFCFFIAFWNLLQLCMVELSSNSRAFLRALYFLIDSPWFPERFFSHLRLGYSVYFFQMLHIHARIRFSFVHEFVTEHQPFFFILSFWGSCQCILIAVEHDIFLPLCMISCREEILICARVCNWTPSAFLF